MPTVISSPTDLHPAWAERFDAGDVEGMLALAEEGSGFVPQPGTLVVGEDYREGLRGFVALGLPIALTLRHSFVVGEIAPLVHDWRSREAGADGTEAG